MKKDPGESELSKREIELIKEINEKYKTFNQWEMVDICHQTLPEWESPGTTSIPIQIEDILKAMHKTDREIALIEEDIANLEYRDFLLSTGKGVIKPHDPVSPELLKKIREGGLKSPAIPLKCLNFLSSNM